MNMHDADDRVVAAGEYVLGTLSADDHAQVEALRATDAALDAEIYRWQDRLAPLAARLGPAELPSGGWAAVEARLDGRGSLPAHPQPAPPQPAPRTPPDAAANDALWTRLRRWRLAAGMGLAASVLLAALLVLRPVQPAGERYLTLLQAPDTQRTGWVVEAVPGGRIRLVAVGPADAVPAGKSLQFWTKPQGAANPTSLGLVRPGASVELPAARSPSIGEQQLFELTLEPESGSPTGRPTGPIVYVGRSVRL